MLIYARLLQGSRVTGPSLVSSSRGDTVLAWLHLKYKSFSATIFYMDNFYKLEFIDTVLQTFRVVFWCSLFSVAYSEATSDF